MSGIIDDKKVGENDRNAPTVYKQDGCGKRGFDGRFLRRLVKI
jgi:hypothetical protein